MSCAFNAKYQGIRLVVLVARLCTADALHHAPVLETQSERLLARTVELYRVRFMTEKLV